VTVPTLQLATVHVLALAAVGYGLGHLALTRLKALERLTLPPSIVGGLALALVQLALRDRVVNFTFELWLRDLLMVAFFTTIGFGARVRLLKEGGLPVLVFFGLAALGAVLQNGLGLSLAQLLGLHPLLGVATGSVALTGGPATALAFGAEFESRGVAGAASAGVAAAMLGITLGGLLGGWIGRQLIERRASNEAAAPAGEVTAPPLEVAGLLPSVGVLAVAMGLGSLLSKAISSLGVVLPAYVGAMLVAAVLRNLDDLRRSPSVSAHHLDAMGEVALQLFIVMALLTLQLWELAHLALPLLAMVVAQVLLVAALCVVVFRVMGRDYEAAVMAGGYCGFMLGTTANAVACMSALTSRFGPAPRAWFVVPMVGAFLIDFANSLLVTSLLNVFAGR
jgi:ESS family glutamate:Na+ symporter